MGKSYANLLCAAAVVGLTFGCASGERQSTEQVSRAQAALALNGTTPTTIQGRNWYTKYVPELGGGAGAASFDNGTLTVSAQNSWGVKSSYYPGPYTDQVQFAYTPFDSGEPDIEMVVRVTSVTGTSGRLQAGLMLRENTSDNALMGTVLYEFGAHTLACPPTATRTLSAFLHVNRTLHGAASVEPNGDPATLPGIFPMLGPANTWALPPDVYLRLQKIGKDYSVAGSDDGTHWRTFLGGDFKPTTGMLGVYVASEPIAPPVPPATATFNVLYVGTPRLQAKTRWIDSSFVKASTDWISRGMQGFYTAPSGKSYKYTFEPLDGLPPSANGGYHPFNKFSTTGALEEIPYGNMLGVSGTLQGGITGDTSNVYTARVSCTSPAAAYCIERRRGTDLKVAAPPGSPLPPGAPPDYPPGRFFPSGTPLGKISGMATRANKLYVSEYDTKKVRVFDTTTLGEVTALGFAVNCPGVAGASATPGPGPLAVDSFGNIWVACSRAGYVKCAGLGAPCNDPLSNGDPDAASRAAMSNFFPEPKFCGPNNACPASSILRCNASGSCSAQSIAVGIPTALAVSPTGVFPERLLIADNGPNQNVVVCLNIGGVPLCSGFGQTGGVFAGPVSGSVTGTSPRFFSPIGVGMDSSGALYVASSAPRVQVQKFSSSTSAATLLWSRHGLGPDPGAFDPASDGNDYYTLTRHYTYDSPSDAFVPKGVTLNPFVNSSLREPDSHRLFPTLPGSAPILRRINGAPFLYVQGYEDVLVPVLGMKDPVPVRTSTLYVYRFTGEVAHPFASLRFKWVEDDNLGTANWLPQLWVDTGALAGEALNGLAETDELQTFNQASLNYAPRQTFGLDVDDDGNIWLAYSQQIKNSVVNTGNVWKLPVTPTTVSGTIVPVYGWTNLVNYDIPDCLPFGVGNTEDTYLVPRYDRTSHSLYLLGKLPLQQLPGYESATTTCTSGLANAVVRLDIGTTCTPNPCEPERPNPCESGQPNITVHPGYPVALPSPAVADPAKGPADPPTFPTDPNYPLTCKCDPYGAYYSFDIAGDMFFVQERNWDVHVHRKDGGAEVARLVAGPEVSGHQNVSDLSLGVMRAFRRNNGEYLITLSDTTQQARTLLFRWPPPQ